MNQNLLTTLGQRSWTFVIPLVILKKRLSIWKKLLQHKILFNGSNKKETVFVDFIKKVFFGYVVLRVTVDILRPLRWVCTFSCLSSSFIFWAWIKLDFGLTETLKLNWALLKKHFFKNSRVIYNRRLNRPNFIEVYHLANLNLFCVKNVINKRLYQRIFWITWK